MSECTHDCSTCGESCSERQEPQSLLKEHHPEAHIGKVFGIMSGKGGDLVLEEAKRVLADEYPECSGKLFPALPDEKSRRVGQSVAAASLPEV